LGRSRDTVKPGTFSTSRIEMPVWGGWAVGSVLHSKATSPDMRAFVIHVFEPLITYPPPTGRASVRIACRSDPPSGSVSAIVARSSPVAIRGR
jgi:hypothetical protein